MTAFGKIWGQTRLLLKTPFMSWYRAQVQQGYCCSIHHHETRHNGFFVESGIMKIRVYHDGGLEDVTTLKAGDYTEVAPGVRHRFECVADCVIHEVYWPKDVRDDDIVRDDVGHKL